MHQINHADATHETMFCTAVLLSDQFDETGVALVLHAVIGNQIRMLAIVDQSAYQFPQMAGSQMLALQIISNSVVAHAIQMLGQMRTCEVGDRADQILYVLTFSNHSRILPRGSNKRKSCICMPPDTGRARSA